MRVCVCVRESVCLCVQQSLIKKLTLEFVSSVAAGSSFPPPHSARPRHRHDGPRVVVINRFSSSPTMRQSKLEQGMLKGDITV